MGNCSESRAAHPFSIPHHALRTGNERETPMNTQSLPPVLARLTAVSVSLKGMPVLQGTSWTLRKGECWLVTGDNGSGKTTLLKAVAGRLPICSGTLVTHFDRPLSQAAAMVSFDREQSMISRENQGDLARHFSGSHSEGTCVSEYLEGRSPASSTDKQQAARMFPRIKELWSNSLRSLSTGELRMVMTAGALATNPDLLILDEPFEGLDPDSRAQMADLIRKVVARGVTVLLATHLLTDLPEVVTHQIHLKQLRVEAITTVSPAGRSGTERHGADLKQSGPAAGGPGVPFPAEQETETVILMRRVTVSYGSRPAIHNLSWTVNLGENWHIRGPNGSGKSTLVSLIYADNPQTYANDISLFGIRRGSGESIWDVKKQIGFVSNSLQMGYQINLSVFRVVLSGFFDSTGLYRTPDTRQKDAALQILDLFQIRDWRQKQFTSLSTGQQRLVLIARALVKKPKILVLDEVCYGLDRTNRQRILTALDALGNDTGRTLIYITHQEDEIPRCMTHRLDLPTNLISRL